MRQRREPRGVGPGPRGARWTPHTVEGENGRREVLVPLATTEGALVASVILPSLLVGTSGGGTGQGIAAECLAILGWVGGGRARALAEVCGAAVLAGDLSLVAAFASHEFVAVHEALGRNRPGQD